jgi:hypothetical protein
MVNDSRREEMNENNLIKNGDFAGGKLEPWVASDKTVKVVEEEGRHYVRIPATYNVHQNPQVPTGPSVLEFHARIRERLDEGQAIIFIAALAIQLTDGSISLLPFAGSVTLDEWQLFTFKVPQHDAVKVTLQITPLGATDGSRLSDLKNLAVGTVEFKLFSLTPAS